MRDEGGETKKLERRKTKGVYENRNTWTAAKTAVNKKCLKIKKIEKTEGRGGTGPQKPWATDQVHRVKYGGIAFPGKDGQPVCKS